MAVRAAAFALPALSNAALGKPAEKHEPSEHDSRYGEENDGLAKRGSSEQVEVEANQPTTIRVVRVRADRPDGEMSDIHAGNDEADEDSTTLYPVPSSDAPSWRGERTDDRSLFGRQVARRTPEPLQQRDDGCSLTHPR